MVGEGLVLEIRVLAKQGNGVQEIARAVGVSCNTVRRYQRAADLVRYRERPMRPGELTGQRVYVAERWPSYARRTCFCGLLRSVAISTRRARSDELRLMAIPVSIRQTRAAPSEEIQCTPMPNTVPGDLQRQDNRPGVAQDRAELFHHGIMHLGKIHSAQASQLSYLSRGLG